MSDHTYRYPEAIVSTEWLQENLDDAALRVFDCTTYLIYETGTGQPYSVKSGRADYETGHVPGAGFLDLQGELSNADSPYRFTMLPAATLAERFGARGIGDDHRVVLYSRDRMQWATRIWWMLRAVGFDNAAILDGGWDKWESEERPISTEPCAYPAASLTPYPRPELFVGKADVQGAIGDSATCTINALSPELHSGDDPRYGRPGRIPGSVNVPATTLYDPVTREFHSPEAVAAAFAEIGAHPSKRTIVYCGGGIAATLDAFLMHQLGYEDIAVYDDSMSQWATDESLPIETD